MSEMREEAYVTDGDQEIRDLLQAHPYAADRLIRLFNTYRELLSMCLVEIQESDAHIDTADFTIAMSKKDAMLRHLGFPTLDTPQEWHAYSTEWDQRRKQLEEAAEEQEKREYHGDFFSRQEKYPALTRLLRKWRDDE